MTDAADQLAALLRLTGVPPPVREHRFGAELAGGAGRGLRERLARQGLRDWRFDLAWPAARLAVEVDGGGWTGGRHARGAGIEADCEKLSSAVAAGWRVLRVTPRQVRDGRAVAWVEQALAGGV